MEGKGENRSFLLPSEHPDIDAPCEVEGIGGNVAPNVLDLEVIDHVERESDADSFAMTKRLWREEGLMVGGSSGTAVVAALRVAQRREIEALVVVLLADSWDRYFSKLWMQ